LDKALEVEQASKRYRNGCGVDRVSLDVSKGEIYGLIGLNGAGKTTLMKMIVGLLRPDRGEIRIFGQRVTDRFEHAIRRVGCLIEAADAYEYLSAYDNLKLAARFYPDLPKSRIDEALERVGLAPYRKERVHGFSLGMKQRLGLASALLSEPQLALLDEPANGLDPEGMAYVRQTIRQLAREQGIAFLVSSHLIHDLERIADRVGIMHGGRMIRQGKVSELLKDGRSLEQFAVSQFQAAKEALAYA